MAVHRHPLTSIVDPEERWTTTDEISHMQSYADRGMLQHLRNALKILPNRRWYGPGMSVDPILVAKAIREMIVTVEAKQINNALREFSESEKTRKQREEEEAERVRALLAAPFPKQDHKVRKKRKSKDDPTLLMNIFRDEEPSVH
jgi:hypothetical protein